MGVSATICTLHTFNVAEDRCLKCVRLNNPWLTDLPATLATKGVAVHACDFANSAIAAMKTRAGNVTFDTQDVTTMSNKYSEGQFDFILDKGCFDSLLVRIP